MAQTDDTVSFSLHPSAGPAAADPAARGDGVLGQAAPMPSLGISVGWGNVPDPTPPGLLKDSRQVGGAASGPCEPLTSEESGASLALGGP